MGAFYCRMYPVAVRTYVSRIGRGQEIESKMPLQILDLPGPLFSTGITYNLYCKEQNTNHLGGKSDTREQQYCNGNRKERNDRPQHALG